MHVIREAVRDRRRLDSWKEIAAYFERDERTVKRWEKEKGLPVHRMPENSGARVFAFTDELSRWMTCPDSSSVAAVDEPIVKQEPPSGENPPAPAPLLSRNLWLVFGVAAATATVLAGVFFFRYQKSRKVSAISSSAAIAVQDGSRHSNPDPVARNLYLSGQYYWDKRTPADLNKAVSYFEQAIDRDPKYAEAYVGLANCYSLLREFAAMPSDEAFPRALAAARKAVELDPSSAEAHNALAFGTFYWNWDAAEAEREFRSAIKLDPNYVTAHHWYATFLMVLGRLPEALEQINQAQQLDPASTADPG